MAAMRDLAGAGTRVLKDVRTVTTLVGGELRFAA
jgi:hypothetical protein